MKLKFFILLLTQIFMLSAGHRDWKPGVFELLDRTERKPARTAVLIVIHPDDSVNLNKYTHCRWQLGKKVWEQYMNTHPNVDCYFVQYTNLREGYSEQTWIEGNTIYVGVARNSCKEEPAALTKTIAAVEKLLPKYTHFFRTNISAFVNLNALNEYAETHHQSMFTSPLRENWYLVGYSILFSTDVANHIVNEYKRLEGSYIVSHHVPEDAVLTSLATGIFPYYDYVRDNNLQVGFIKENLKFTCCPTLPLDVPQLMCRLSFTTTPTNRLSQYGLLLFPPPSFEQTIDYCSQALNSALLYRIRSGFDLDKLAEVYEYLLNNIYPELPKFDLVEYAKSFPTIRDNS